MKSNGKKTTFRRWFNHSREKDYLAKRMNPDVYRSIVSMTRLVHDRGFLQVNQVIPNLYFILVVPLIHLGNIILAPQGVTS